MKRGRDVGARLHAGTVNINEGYAAAWGSIDAPMGGVGESGLGPAARHRGPAQVHRGADARPPAADEHRPAGQRQPGDLRQGDDDRAVGLMKKLGWR